MDPQQMVDERMNRRERGVVSLRLVLADATVCVDLDLGGKRPVRLDDERLGALIDGLTQIRAARNEAAVTLGAIAGSIEITV